MDELKDILTALDGAHSLGFEQLPKDIQDKAHMSAAWGNNLAYSDALANGRRQAHDQAFQRLKDLVAELQKDRNRLNFLIKHEAVVSDYGGWSVWVQVAQEDFERLDQGKSDSARQAIDNAIAMHLER